MSNMESVSKNQKENSSQQENNCNSSQNVGKAVYAECLDNGKFFSTTTNLQNRNNFNVENATNSHPLLNTISPDYPDVIPKSKLVVDFAEANIPPLAHSSENELEIELSSDSQDSLEKKLHSELPAFNEYMQKLPDFPASPSVLKKSMIYDMPIEVSQTELSDTENDRSIYEAHLSPNLQNVTLKLNEKEGNLNFLAQKKQSNKLRLIKVVPATSDISPDSDDISSIESFSESLKSENVYAGPIREVDVNSYEDKRPSTETIEPVSVEDERRQTRNWQRMVLPDGEQRTIDMRVIEPYKRVLSHGGYLRAGGHTAIVIFSACFLPDRSRIDYDYVMDNLFLYVLWTLDRLVTDNYILVYLHGGASRLPSFSWIKRCYQMVGRKLRKNLSHLYLVHPSLWIKTMLFMAKPFISSKFYRKLSFISNLRELLNRIPLESAAIPEKVKAYDRLHCE